jgi:adenylate cyclase, class 2
VSRVSVSPCSSKQSRAAPGGQAVDEGTGSKPETEVEVSDGRAVDEIRPALGFTHLVTFEKHCVNYSFRAAGRDIMATVVTVPELEGTFIEVETMAEDGDVGPALALVRSVLANLGIADVDLTTELYTEAVMRRRSGGSVARSLS